MIRCLFTCLKMFDMSSTTRHPTHIPTLDDNNTTSWCPFVDIHSMYAKNVDKMRCHQDVHRLHCVTNSLTNLFANWFKPKCRSINGTFHLNLYLLLMLTCIGSVMTECQFPHNWTGNWFQKGVPDSIKIFNSSISEKGICRQSNGEKFLIENRNEKCVRCLVINERHPNLLQYKETFSCHPIDGRLSIESVCSEINGDAPLYSLFKLDIPSVQCPFQGPFTFSYSRGSGECKDPISQIDSCTDDKHLLFRFKACADVHGSESRVEELECFADWKEGSYRYLVGKLHYDSAKTDEDKFRCFVFDKIKDAPEGYEIAQSGDATCDGLLSPKDGSRTMKIYKTIGVIPRCQFPKWLTLHRHWKSLDGSHVYDFNRNNNSFIVYNVTNIGEVIRQSLCINRENVTTSVSSDAFDVSQYVVHFTSGCKSGYICLRIFKRTNHIIELQYGNSAKQASDACSQHHFKPFHTKYLTLTTMSPDTYDCPFEGIYAVNVPDGGIYNNVNDRQLIPSNEKSLLLCTGHSLLNSRCNSNDHIQLQSKCAFNENIRNFRCRGGWSENGTNFLIASSNEEGIRQYCFAYDQSGHDLKMTISSDTCFRRNTNFATFRDSHLALSLINKGMCNQVRSYAHKRHINNIAIVVKTMFLLTTHYLLVTL